MIKTKKMKNDLKFSGEQLRDSGMQLAIESAEKKNENWAELAYNFLLNYSKRHKEFMIEDVRNASKGFVPFPPSNRAWGGIVRKMAKNGLIYRKGYKTVKNPKAHCTPATLWAVS